MSPRVLIAEDNPGLARVMAFNMKSKGLTVVVAHRGDDAWQMLQQEDFSLLVSDYEMPGMDGITLVRAIRKVERLAHLPVILITGRQMELETNALQAELAIEAIFPKPFSPLKVLALAESILTNSLPISSS